VSLETLGVAAANFAMESEHRVPTLLPLPLAMAGRYNFERGN
jgi:hypothetical protein